MGEKLQAEGIVSADEAQAMVDAVRQKLTEAKEAAAKIVAGGASADNYPDAEADKPQKSRYGEFPRIVCAHMNDGHY